MNKGRHFLAGIGALLGACGSLFSQTAPLTNTVVGTFNTASFTVNGQANPSLTLQRGVTYVFQINESAAPIHPFYIKTALSIGAGDAYNNGVTGNGTINGNLIFAVPMDAPDTLYYHCGAHPLMGGTLNIVSPPSPPEVKIVLVTLTETNVVMQSLGPTNWTVVPEFSSNLTLNAWMTVPNYTNTFANGTNTTTFDRLDPICGPNVYLRVRNQSQ